VPTLLIERLKREFEDSNKQVTDTKTITAKKSAKSDKKANPMRVGV